MDQNAPGIPSANQLGQNSKSTFFKNFKSNISKKSLIISSIIFLVLALIIIITINFLIPKNDEAVYQSINAEFIKGNFSKSNEIAISLLEKNPNDSKALAAVITTIATEGNHNGTEAEAFNKAQPYLERAKKINTQERDLNISMGYMYETAGFYDEALNYYQLARDIDPEFGVVYFHIGHIYEFLQNQTLAFDEYDKAYALDKNNALILMGQARKNGIRGDLNRAFQLYKDASEIKTASPHDKAESLTNMAIIKRGQVLYMQEATEYAKQAIDLSPNFSPALGEYGLLLSLNGNPAKGVTYIDKAITSNPRITLNYFYMGNVLENDNQFKEADSYYMQALEKIKTDNTILSVSAKDNLAGRILYRIARVRWQLGERNQQILFQLISNAVKVNPEIKILLDKDYRVRGFFAVLSSSPEFMRLLE